MLSSEYAAKYLEAIGVKPSKSTVELVHKNVPLTDSCIKTTFRVTNRLRPIAMSTTYPALLAGLACMVFSYPNILHEYWPLCMHEYSMPHRVLQF